MDKSKRNIPADNILTYKDFIGTVSFSAVDNVLHGKLTGINDLVTYEGESVNELKLAFEEAVEDYIETCKMLDKPLFKSCKGSFNVRIPQELHYKASKLANVLNISLNKFVQSALEREVKENADLL